MPVVAGAGAQVQVYRVMQVQTQYTFAVYCVVHKIPFWLDPQQQQQHIYSYDRALR